MSDHYSLYITQDPEGKLEAIPKPILPSAMYSSKPYKETRTKQSTPEIEDIDGEEYVRWGSNDRCGTEFREKVEKVPLAGITIRKQTQMMYGNGLVYYSKEDLKNGAKVKRSYNEEVEAFLIRNRIHTKWLPQQIQDYRMFLSSFGELIISNDRSAITGIRHIGTEYARKDLYSKNLYFSYEFERSNANSSNWEKMPLLPDYDIKEYLDKSRAYKIGYHSQYSTSGSIHYPNPPWFALSKENGWLDVSAAVPEIIHSMQRNQVMIKYQINIPYSYFSTRDADWTTYSNEKKKELMDEKVKALNDMLSDTDNLFKSIATIYMDEPGMSDKGGLIDIIPIDDKTKNDSWVPSSNASDAQIVQGLEMHPSQIGLAPEGGKMGAGSGSDQRESFNTVITLNTIDQMIVLDPLNMISEYNGWGVHFAIDHTHHTTTNNQESGLEPSEDTIELENP